jgi:hypothetical protein
MRLAAPFVLSALLLACASSPPPPSERPLAGTSSVQRNAATLELRSYYSVKPDRSVELLVDLTPGGTGSVGPVDLALTTDGFLIDGPATWQGEAAAPKTRVTFVLRPQGDGGKWARVIFKSAAGESSSFSTFLVTPDEIRLCQQDDEPCKSLRDPSPAP